MKTILVTGSGGLIGSESTKFFLNKGFKVIGIDNNMREYFFGKEASTAWNVDNLNKLENYEHHNTDIRMYVHLEHIFKNNKIDGIIHTAAQPSHDWSAKNPMVDFSVNANGTLNLLELTRKYCPTSPFIFCSSNKIYGDTPNNFNYIEDQTRFEPLSGAICNGFNETLSIDQSTHSLFGVSKLSADILVQEYGRYFDMPTVCFRGGCLTGPSHFPTQLHGFLAYLILCCMKGTPYTIFGYKGKQVRDNIHSYDLVNAFWQYFQNPTKGEVYNIGGSRHSNCSMLEAIELCEEIAGKKLKYTYSDQHRKGDHIWYISDISKFKSHYPDWKYKYDLKGLMEDIYNGIHIQ